MSFMTKTTIAAGLAGIALTSAAFADGNEGLSATKMAEIIAIYHNDAEPKDANTEALTFARMDAIKVAFNDGLDTSPEVDSLSPVRMAVIKTQFADYLQIEPPRPLTFVKAPVGE